MKLRFICNDMLICAFWDTLPDYWFVCRIIGLSARLLVCLLDLVLWPNVKSMLWAIWVHPLDCVTFMVSLGMVFGPYGI